LCFGKKIRFKKMVLAQMTSWGKYPFNRHVKICSEKSKTIIANFNAWDEVVHIRTQQAPNVRGMDM
jgi:hypothetical protein